jgi:hypothetical protein
MISGMVPVVEPGVRCDSTPGFKLEFYASGGFFLHLASVDVVYENRLLTHWCLTVPQH